INNDSIMTRVYFEKLVTQLLCWWQLTCLLVSFSCAQINMTSTSTLSSMRRLVEQLKLEASVERIKVSQAAAELQQYCLQNAGKDALLVGVPTGSNPFREPRSCSIV
uniref:Guanine nucleotide-binding protein subunit gamma n=1 Tax=Neogobius melanostomus TaxID=47308 RepID=A0A8C6S774_9GOBI